MVLILPISKIRARKQEKRLELTYQNRKPFLWSVLCVVSWTLEGKWFGSLTVVNGYKLVRELRLPAFLKYIRVHDDLIYSNDSSQRSDLSLHIIIACAPPQIISIAQSIVIWLLFASDVETAYILLDF